MKAWLWLVVLYGLLLALGREGTVHVVRRDQAREHIREATEDIGPPTGGGDGGGGGALASHCRSPDDADSRAVERADREDTGPGVAVDARRAVGGAPHGRRGGRRRAAAAPSHVVADAQSSAELHHSPASGQSRSAARARPHGTTPRGGGTGFTRPRSPFRNRL